MNHLLLRLDALTLQDRGYMGLNIAEIHEIVILSELASDDAEADPRNWYAPASAGPARLQHLGLAHYAFCASVSEDWQQTGTELHYYLLATQPPITLLAYTPETATQAAPRQLLGLVGLRMSWPELNEAPLMAELSVRIAGFQRLIMQPGPDFGRLISLNSLAPAPPGHDQLFIEVELIPHRLPSGHR